MLGVSKNRAMTFLYGAIALVAILCAVSLYLSSKEQAALLRVTTHIESGRESLALLAEFTNRNTVSPDIESILRDCALRNEYESMLNQLDAVPDSELPRVVLLSEACGDFFALKKRVMVREMQSALDELAAYVDLYREYSGSTLYDATIAEWDMIVQEEQKQADLLSEQAIVQKQVIEGKQLGRAADITRLLARGAEINQNLEVGAGAVLSYRAQEKETWAGVLAAE